MENAQSVKVNKLTLKRIKRHVIDSGQTISEFIEDVLSKKLDAIDKRKSNMGSQISESTKD